MGYIDSIETLLSAIRTIFYAITLKLVRHVLVVRRHPKWECFGVPLAERRPGVVERLVVVAVVVG